MAFTQAPNWFFQWGLFVALSAKKRSPIRTPFWKALFRITVWVSGHVHLDHDYRQNPTPAAATAITIKPTAATATLGRSSRGRASLITSGRPINSSTLSALIAASWLFSVHGHKGKPTWTTHSRSFTINTSSTPPWDSNRLLISSNLASNERFLRTF